MAWKRRMRRKYGKSLGYAYSRGKKWSTETALLIPAWQANSLATAKKTVVPETSIQGSRKAGYFTINFASSQVTDANLPAFYWVMAYVPEGGEASNIAVAENTDIYQPSNYVMGAGTWQPGSQNRFKVNVQRKLNAGDKIKLCVVPLAQFNQNMSINAVVSYKITF